MNEHREEPMAPKVDPIESILVAAVEITSDAERRAYVEGACAGDAELKRRVEELIDNHFRAGSFLEFPAPELGATTDPPVAERPGTVIGPYKLLEQIGEGGFGVVFMAEQTEPVRRKVALKVLKLGMDTRQVVARFEAERQALAIMDHPNIARVFDGGATASGRLYFVMELVKGVPITEFCDQNHLTPRQRLELFLPVCQAVQHAHQKGIIHRDLKPSNVLVSRHDTTPVVKVIDFGVAKALGQELTDKTLYTGVAQMIGTPLYMSPEQAGMSDLDVDTRSDIYSLGVLLYELLTGTTPFDKDRFKNATYDEIRRIIREEEPPKPSTRLSTLGQAATTVSANCGTELRRLSILARGELDWIVMKALEKDRNRRYETANSFALDVQRYLADEPVQACPPSTGYWLRKFARRNRRALVTAGLLAFALLVTVGAVAGSIGWATRDQAARQAAAEQEARRAFDEAERWMEQEKWPEALAFVLRGEALLAGGGSDELRDRAHQLRKDLEMMLRVDDLEFLSVELWYESHEWDLMEQGYAKAFADYGIDVLNVPVKEAAARIRERHRLAIPLARTLDVWACAPTVLSTPPSEKTSANRTRIRAVAGMVDPDPWRRQVREAVQNNDGKTLAALADSPDLAQQPLNNLVVLQRGLEFCELYEKAIDVLRVVQRQYPGDFWANFYLAHDLHFTPYFLGHDLHLSLQSQREEVIAFARAAVAIRPKCGAAHLVLALALQQKWKFDEAVVYHHKAIELAPNNHNAYFWLGWTLRFQGKYEEAAACYQKAIDLWPENYSAYIFLGYTLNAQKKWDEAIVAFRKAIKITLNKPNNQKKPSAYRGLGNALCAQGKLEEAIVIYNNAIEIAPKDSRIHVEVGNALSDLGKLDEAIVHYNNAIDVDPKNGYAHHNLGWAFHKQGKYDAAIVSYQKAIELDSNDYWAYNYLGSTLSAQKKPVGAIAAFNRAIGINPKFVPAYFNLALTQHARLSLDDAIATYRSLISLDSKRTNSQIGLAIQAPAFNSLNSKRTNSQIGPTTALRDQEKWDVAISCYRRAIRLVADADNDARQSFGANLSTAAWQLAMVDWQLNTAPDPKFRNPDFAVELAREAVRLNPVGDHWNTLGVAHYRAGQLKAAVTALEQSMKLRKGGDSFDWFFLAMSYWKLGDKGEARRWYEKAVAWMSEKQPQDGELVRFRAEASALLGVAVKGGAEVAQPARAKQ
jgi:eukaryotic-like serine/threonine-protein kinase